MNTVMLHRLDETEYTDQHGFKHECYRVIETVVVTRSEDYYEYDYYSQPVKNWYYDSGDGRRWMCHTQVDYGGSSSWTRRVDGERVKSEKWIRDDRKEDKKGEPHWHGRKPVVFPLEEREA